MSAPAEVDCKRCGRQAPALAAPPQPGPTGEEIRENICVDCWAEWQHAEVIVINELRLNFMDPRSLEILEYHMKEFLMLAPPSASGGPPLGPEAPGS